MEHVRSTPQRQAWIGEAKRVAQFVVLHGRLPEEISDDPAEEHLFRWLRAARIDVRKGRLDDRMADFLDSTAPGWRNSTEDRWKTHLAELVEAAPVSGIVPADLPGPLYRWLMAQRRAAAEGTLDERRLKVLDEQVPGWQHNRDDNWLNRAADLKDYLDWHGRLPVFTRGRGEPAALFRWLNHQRTLARKGLLSERRRNWLDLNTPGWLPFAGTRDEAWEATAGALAQYTQNHAAFPSTSDPEVRRLARWLSTQRSSVRRGHLREDRKEWLDRHIPDWRGNTN